MRLGLKRYPDIRNLLGNAADVAVEGTAPAEVAAAAEALGFPGVGRYAGFTHVDVREAGSVRWER